MICFNDFIEKFKGAVQNPYLKPTSTKVHFCVEFKNEDPGVVHKEEWYSRLMVKGFKRESTLLYLRDHSSSQPRPSTSVDSRTPLPFQYGKFWQIVELVRPTSSTPLIVRIKRNFHSTTY